jgi:D-sedoheptulose 7-phosphate isomerase
VESYYERMIAALREFDRVPLNAVLDVMTDTASRGATLWLAGNGGSAAVCNHAVCDLSKATAAWQAPLRCASLAANVPLMLAIANDSGFEEVFTSQLAQQGRPEDTLLLVSSSGNSLNLVKACEYANALGITTIAFVGFSGGRLRDLARHMLWIPSDNYGIVEDAHQSLLHLMAQYMKARAEPPAHVRVI